MSDSPETRGSASETAEHWLETGRLAELGMLSAEMVHELRQPVFAVKAMAQLLRARQVSDDHSALDQMLEQVQLLEVLLGRYAGSARRPSGRPAPILLGPPVEAGAALLRARAQARGLVLRVEIDTYDTPVLGDPIAVQQMTMNLVNNALDAARGRVEVCAGGGTLEVRDDGPGLAEEVARRLFEPFVTTKAPGQGTGLGLALVRRLSEAAGAELTVSSTSQGTSVKVIFVPLLRDDPGHRSQP